MDDLTRWLGQQYDEDERIAREACEYAEAEWRLDEDGETVLWWPPEPHIAEKEREKGLPVVSDHWRGQTIESGGARLAPHIVAWNPARVLREIDAKRQVLRDYELSVQAVEALTAQREHLKAKGQDLFMTDMDLGTAIVKRDTLHGVMRLHVAVYAHRPGYRESWRP
jgi:hypothetical protein